MEEAAGRVERQARREQAAAEAEARQLHLASRTLTDVVWEAMQQGHRIRLTWPGGDLTGVPSAAVGDLVVVRTEVGAAGANVPVVSSVEVVERNVDRGSAGDRTVESFVAWCRMVEGRQVRIAMLGGREVEGTLVATATDHLLVRSRHDDQMALARSQVAAVSVAGDPFLPL
jgi:hypothetical protein